MRRWPALVLTVLAMSAAAAIMPASASSQTIGDLGLTTGLIGILGGLNLGQVNVPQTTDPYATQPADPGTGTTEPETTTQQPVVQSPRYYCKGQSKRRVAGKKYTPFSRCVTAMKKLAAGTETSPRSACRLLSRKRTGSRKSPFALCVAGGKRLLADKAAGSSG